MKQWILSVMALAASGVGAAERVDYLEQVKPLLAEHCAACHGALAQRGGLRLDAAQLILRGGDSGRPLVPGQPAASLLIERITATDSEERMPPEGEPLNAEQIEIPPPAAIHAEPFSIRKLFSMMRYFGPAAVVASLSLGAGETIMATGRTWQCDGSDNAGRSSLETRFATPKKPSHNPITFR